MKVINLIKRLLEGPFSFSFAITTVVFTFLPEQFLKLKNCGIEFLGGGVLVGRIAVFSFVTVIVLLCWGLWLCLRKSVVFDDGECIIEVKYGDLFTEEGCKRVISFDECFTTHIGNAPGDIKATSICGQFLNANPELDVAALVEQSELHPVSTPSLFNDKKRFLPGSVVQFEDNLLVSFAKLNVDGRAEFTCREEFLDCLTRLWREIYKYSGQKDVCIPILGSGVTGFSGGSGKSLSQQELLDIIIWSYKLSARKIKRPQRLRIICRKQDSFSLNKIQAR